MAGGLAGGISVMVLKYVTQGAQGNQLWFGVSNLVANGLVMLRYGKLIADVGSARRLTEIQFRDPVGQPEHGGRLHLQSSFVNPTGPETINATALLPVRLIQCDHDSHPAT
jgi:hypothetical protein